MRARLTLLAVVCTLVATVAGGTAAGVEPVTVAPGHTGAAVAASLPAWGDEPVPQGGSGRSELRGISVLSADDAWAVGNTGYQYDPTAGPLVERWDGSAWSVVDVPGITGAVLYGVAAVDTDDVWMVGSFNSTREALILHWDGSTVDRIENPNPGSNRNDLYAITATGSDDVWAVGSKTSDISDPLTLHWNGVAWRAVDAPGTGGYDELNGVTAVAPDDAWAVGRCDSAACSVHWNGRKWQSVDVGVSGVSTSLAAVDAVSSDEVWAVGQDSEGTLAARWNGSRWRVVEVPDSGGYLRDDLLGVATVAADDVWVGGTSYVGADPASLALHWNGRRWQAVSTPHPPQSSSAIGAMSAGPSGALFTAGSLDRRASVLRLERGGLVEVPVEQAGTDSNQLLGISAAATDDIWAVGALGEFHPEALTLHYDGSEWTQVDAPEPASGTQLEDVVALTDDDAWAVGHTNPGDFGNAVALHWDGTSWRSVRVPQPGDRYASPRLLAVDALAGDNVWAVGAYDAASSPETTIMHWDGSRWRLADTSRCNPYGGLAGLTFLSADDGWAVGQASICHWNGRRWTLVPSPQPRPNYFEVNYPLEDVSGAASDDVWAVGTVVFDFQDYLSFGSFTEHWDGSAWQRVSNPSGVGLSGVEAVTASDVWAVGRDDFGPIIVRWDGHQWDDVPTPDRENGIEIESITRAGDDLWNAGRSFDESSDDYRGLVQRAPSPTQGAVIGTSNVGHATIAYTGPARGVVTSSPTGGFQIGGLPAGRYRFTLVHEGCDPLTKRVDITAGRTRSVQLTADCH